MGFDQRLQQLSRRAATAAQRDFVARTRDVSRLINGILKTNKWHDLPARTQKHFDDAIEAAQFAAEVSDASECVNDYLLRATNGRVCDLRLAGRPLLDVQDRILDLFDKGSVPSRGFVYVAWTAKPTSYTYVGKAGDTSRLNLARHGKLAHAAAYASTISLLFPSQSRQEMLLNVEASVIRLIEHQTGKLPELNIKPELVPDGTRSSELQRLSSFLRGVADKLEPFEDDQAVGDA